MFVDASAICAILLDEAEAAALAEKLSAASSRITSPIAVFEAVLAFARVTGVEIAVARVHVSRFMTVSQIETVVVDAAEREAALDAMDRFGKGRHPARLNMGDCFAYACAKVHGLPLLFKGDDFSKTDIPAA